MTVHSFSTRYKQNSSDNLPSYLQTNITAQMLSIRGEGVVVSRSDELLHTETWLLQRSAVSIIHHGLFFGQWRWRQKLASRM